MSKLVPEVEMPQPKKIAFAECPRCSQPVDGFHVDETAIDDVVITLKPCGCAAHSSDGHYSQFVEVTKRSGSLS